MTRRGGAPRRLTVGVSLSLAAAGALVALVGAQGRNTLTYPIVDTGQGACYGDARAADCLGPESPFYGQDSQYRGRLASYVDNGDGTVFDIHTGLTWQQEIGPKVTYAQAVQGASALTLGGYTDWRLPTIKELYSLILFDGTDVSPCMSGGTCTGIPFVNAAYFEFEYGDASAGERVIDAQYWSSTEYVWTTMGGDATVFGVNFADGRIKGYPRDRGPQGQPMQEFVRYVRGNPDYGRNLFEDNGNGTITDRATDLMWAKADSGRGLTWQEALAHCKGSTYAGYDDWRLPNAKELQSIVDYTRAPNTTGSAAIDPLFRVTAIANEAGQADYPWFWSSTTHVASNGTGAYGVYVAFGRAMGYMNGAWIEVHGAGAQRSDPKSGDPANWPQGHGPQGDAIRIYNYARCVRAGGVVPDPDGDPTSTRPAVVIPSGGSSPGPQPPGGPTGPGPQPPGGGTPGPQPPPEAIAACQARRQGDPCTFTTPRGSITGLCAVIQTQLACVPPGGPPSRRD
ncbi:MAG: DUF1566 domain-containing protein [Acidobacteriota bacterium]